MAKYGNNWSRTENITFCTKYGKNPSRTVDATERTRFSRPRPNDLEDIGQVQRSLYATYPLILVIICAKYGKKSIETVDRQTDRQTGWIQYTPTNFVAEGIMSGNTSNFDWPIYCFATSLISHTTQKTPGPCLNIKTIVPGMGILC